jgi:copper chaperone
MKKGQVIMKTIKVKGMSCQHCVMAVTKALDGIEGIKNVTVDLEGGEASFDETEPVDRETIRERISNAGYEVE